MTWLTALAALVLLAIAGLVYLFWYFKWEERHTRGMAYYGLPLAGRPRLKNRIKLLSLPAKPILFSDRRALTEQAVDAYFVYEGVAGRRRRAVLKSSRPPERTRPRAKMSSSPRKCGAAQRGCSRSSMRSSIAATAI
jgi:hypothetical protein